MLFLPVDHFVDCVLLLSKFIFQLDHASLGEIIRVFVFWLCLLWTEYARVDHADVAAKHFESVIKFLFIIRSTPF